MPIELFVPEAGQWLSTSKSRVAPDGYSWLQGVHWVAGAGLYKPRRHRSHGPRSFGPTTVFIAQLLAELSPCRPGITYLMRRSGLSERAVEYHLQMLRETGLLAWEMRGTRVRGERDQASVFVRMLPQEFDTALGIRTVLRDETAPAYTRALSGISEVGRKLMARLGKKAVRRVRRPRPATASGTGTRAVRRKASGASATAVPGGARCTPMESSADSSSTEGSTSFPPESKLANGGSKSSVPSESTGSSRGPRKLNRVGRRFQLARELTREIDWLHGCSLPRIAWVAREVADAGWTVTDVQGWMHLRGEPARVRRGSGMLAVLLSNAVTVLDTPAKRAAAVERWRDAQEAARRHRIHQVRAARERYEGEWQTPSSPRIQREVEAAFAQVRGLNSSFRQHGRYHGADEQAASAQPDQQELAQLRLVAASELMRGETTLITSLDLATAVDIYGVELVRRAHQLAAGARSSLMTYTHW
ncbi:transcriptional regulator [Streptomyces sp. NPDC094468]|uniref:transcriptional regulator n=1 Tax=Streptomyces sp. NPDC094468 TaxID=3366066 RepID=UPI00382E1860